jgi:methylated-DNA-[protein]-cysteine S-methyltransferase
MKLNIDSFAVPRFGPVIIGVTDKGLRFVTFGPKASVADAYEYAAKSKLEAAENQDITGEPKEQLQQYFAGKRKQFEIALDIEHLEKFTQDVLLATSKIPYGQTISYGELARRVDSTAFRAIGRIMGNNPIPVIIPCHRVVGSNGRLTGFALGLDIKRKLLDFESSQLQLF